jgi:hypothetical protein
MHRGSSRAKSVTVRLVAAVGRMVQRIPCAVSSPLSANDTLLLVRGVVHVRDTPSD